MLACRGAFRACIGPQLTLYAAEPRVNVGPLLDAIRLHLEKSRLSRKVHGLRVFTCWDGGQMTANEVLLDNEVWPEGQALVAGYEWPKPRHLWATRLFLLLVPA
jgi:hypothetical protein